MGMGEVGDKCVKEFFVYALWSWWCEGLELGREEGRKGKRTLMFDLSSSWNGSSSSSKSTPLRIMLLVEESKQRNRKSFTYMMVKLMLREFILSAVASQSSISIGLSASVSRTILRVHFLRVARYLS